MLPRHHRLTDGRDFRAVIRRGARASGAHVTVALRQDSGDREEQAPTTWRCGFVVSKAIGNAVVRHRTQRRLRHIVAAVMEPVLAEQAGDSEGDGPAGTWEIVVRALPGIHEVDHSHLRDDVAVTMSKTLRVWRERQARSAASRRQARQSGGAR